MKIVTWNVNGIRSAFRKDFLKWIKKEKPDIVCLQEIKANSEELSEDIKNIEGYYSYFNSAVKRGYAGVAVYTKIKPSLVNCKFGIERFDNEGRSFELTFKDFILYNFYIPHGGRKKENIDYKLDVYKKLFSKLKKISNKNVIICGDFNIAHNELDLYYPKQNKNNIMFTPKERQQIDIIEKIGYIDTFRKKHPKDKSYTWWPYAFNARERNIGWRIDYIFVNRKNIDKIKTASMRKEVKASDHAAYVLELKDN